MERLARLAIVPIVRAQFRVVDTFETNERAAGGFVSTGAA